MRRSLLSLALAFTAAAAGLALPAPAAAQTRADSAAVLLDAARRFEAQGRNEVADALFDLILERFRDTAAAGEVRRLRSAMPAGRASRGGRVELQVWGTLYGLWLGVAVPLMLGADDPEPYGIGLLVGGPLGFLASRAYANSRSLSEGQARAITLAGTWGTWQGFGWAQVLDLGIRNERVCPGIGPCYDQETGDTAEELTAAAVGGGMAGIVIGALISRRNVPTGLAATVNYGSLWGSWIGLAAGILGDAEGDALLAAALIGGNAGLATTAVLGPRWNFSRNRARLISLAGLVGGLAGAGIDLLVQPDDEKVAVGIPLATSLAGLAFGVPATRAHDRPPAGPGGGDDGAALLRIDRSGPLQLDVPRPAPALLPDRRGRPRIPAISLTLLHARF
jgi:hypothetical protein